MSAQPIQDTEAFRDSISTVDKEGKRVWIYPKKPKGRFYKWRTWLSWVLLAFLFGAPFVKIDGEQLLLFNIIERKFVIFGLVFAPQDFYLFVLAMITFMVFIVLFTVVFGRLFCGWICPQTIFMEMVYRKIEYWLEGDANQQRKLNKAPWTFNKIWRKGLKFALFFGIAVLVANTFLAYIIGSEEVINIATQPVSQNLGGFIAMIIFSLVFFFVFAYMREQVCIAICPYGRLQGVMLDQNSIVVAYDFVRGEPRGKIKKKKKVAAKSENPVVGIQQMVASAASPTGLAEQAPTEPELGDCIDCKLCVQVCPTGIDIRNGTQLECINCTACMDACDEVMEKIDRPLGLIRYDSYNGIVEQKQKIFNTRVTAYSVVLGILLLINGILLTSRNDVDVLILRSQGQTYRMVNEQTISNLYTFDIINKTKTEMPIEFKLVGIDGVIKMVPEGAVPRTIPNDVTKGVFIVELDPKDLDGQSTKIKFEVYSEGRLMDKVTTGFLGPINGN